MLFIFVMRLKHIVTVFIALLAPDGVYVIGRVLRSAIIIKLNEKRWTINDIISCSISIGRCH